VGTLCIERIKCGHDIPQCIATALLLGKYHLCRVGARGRLFVDYGKVRIMRISRGGEACDLVLSRSCSEPIMVPEPPRYPLIVIDLSLWGMHRESEKRELVEQILASLNVVRRFLWDQNLVISNPNQEFTHMLQTMASGLRHRMILAEKIPVLGGSTVLLDPQGDHVLNDEDVLRNNVFILGGIVDKEIKRRGATTRLHELLGLGKLGVPRYRVELRGSRVGVPDRLNKLVEIILLARFVSGLEDAIMMTQSRRDRVNRLVREIQRNSTRVDGGFVVTREDLLRINWLGAGEDEVAAALRRTHATVANEGECLNQEGPCGNYGQAIA
jgi:tRNA (adenine9-N1/guanine9-N1)-methyltransferase